MKNLFSVLSLLLFTVSCEKGTLLSTDLGKCTFSDNEWFVEREIRNVEGTVILDSLETFVISFEDREETGWERIIACNMPQSFKITNTKVKISGKIYSHPRMDYLYAPIELGSISLQNN